MRALSYRSLNNEGTEHSLSQCHWKMAVWIQDIWVNLYITLKGSISWGSWIKICRGFPSVTDKWPFQDHLPSKNYHTDSMSSVSWEVLQCQRQMAFQDHLLSGSQPSWSYVSLEIWIDLRGLNVQSWVFFSATKKQSFQDHLLSNSTISTQWDLSPRKCSFSWKIYDECTEHSLLQHHLQMTFSRPSSK